MKKFFMMMAIFCAILGSTYAMAEEGTNKTIKMNTTIYDELSLYSEVDCFNFSLSKPGNLQIDFDFDIAGKYNVRLINVSSNFVVQNNNFYSEVNTVNGRYERSGNKVRIPEGEYKIIVSTTSNYFSDEEYELKVNYTSESSDNYEKEYNNTAKSAMVIDCNQRVKGNLESIDDVDYYMVKLKKPGSLQLRLEFEDDAQYSANLYTEKNGSLKQIQSIKFFKEFSSDYNSEFADKVRVQTGNYYVKLCQNSSKTYTNEDYTISFVYESQVHGNYENEPNDEAKNATQIYESEEIIGNLNSKYDVDYYMIDLWGYSKIYVNMNVPQNSCYYLTLYKEENGKLKQKASGTIDGSQNYIPVEIEDGNYFFKISSKTYSNEDYMFSVYTSLNETNVSRSIILQADNEYMNVNGTRMLIDGERGTKPVIINGRMLLPIRAIVENLGGSVEWNSTKNSTILRLGNINIDMPIGNDFAYVNGNVKYLEVPTQTINGRTMLPVRFIIENLGGEILWNDASKIVTINY